MVDNFTRDGLADFNITSPSGASDKLNSLSEVETSGKSILRPYYNPETFNANYDARYIPKEGIIDSHGFPLVAKLKSISSLVQQQQPSSSNSSSQSWWFKFKQDNSGYGRSTGANYNSSGGGINFSGMGNDYYDNRSFYSLKDYLHLKKWIEFIKLFSFKFGKVYLKHLIIQPFVVSKTFLQVHDFSNKYDNDDLINSKELLENNAKPEKEIVYFKSKDASELLIKIPGKNQEAEDVDNSKDMDADTPPVEESNSRKAYRIHPTDSSTTKVIESIYEIEGTFGVVRSNNTTFIYNFLSGSLEAWLNGFISSFFNMPNPNFVEVSLSNNLTLSIALVLTSTLITGIVLLPLELLNMKFIVTKMRHIHFSRSIRVHIKKLRMKSFFKSLFTKPKNIKLLIFQGLNRINSTIYHKSLLQTVLLNRFFEIDKFSNYKGYETGNFLIKFCQLIVKVPLDNLYKREQVHYLLDIKRSDESNSLTISNKNDLIIVPHKNIPLLEYFTNINNFKGLWKGYRLELIGVGCGYLLSLLDTKRDSIEEERF